jgi:hypothetical protein
MRHAMTDSHSAADGAVPRGPTTTEGFLADRMKFWASFTRFTTFVALFLVVLLAALWWFLV